ncbi:MAG: GMC family oxidoreductase N-terminal domain-containing protein, partial [Myxococcota bacterium]|nr:GMC family oxidoreductase N-terminal domain-containing protein [Myxococcota bacterium]
MTHIAFQPKGPRVELEADYVVVGSGAGGATVAVDLARGGASVALVEAGAWRDPEDYPHSLYGALRDMTDEWASLVVRGRALWPLLQARVMGGGTVINSAIVVRTPGDIFQEWTRDHGVGGDPMADRMWAAQDQLEEELHVSPVPAAAAGRSNELARTGSVAIDAHDHEMHRNVRDCLGTGQCLQGCRANRKQSTNISYIPEVMNRGGTILSCAPVRRVILEGRRAVGVKGRFKHPQTHKTGAEFVVRAKRAVVMAASVTHSPMLLQRSGVRNKSLGHYFRAHPGSGIFGAYDDEVRSNEGATQGWSSTRFREEHGLKLETLGLPLELAPSRLSGGGALLMERLQEYPHLAMWILAVRAEAVGRITRGTFGQLNVSYTLG